MYHRSYVTDNTHTSTDQPYLCCDLTNQSLFLVKWPVSFIFMSFLFLISYSITIPLVTKKNGSEKDRYASTSTCVCFLSVGRITMWFCRVNYVLFVQIWYCSPKTAMIEWKWAKMDVENMTHGERHRSTEKQNNKNLQSCMIIWVKCSTTREEKIVHSVFAL